MSVSAEAGSLPYKIITNQTGRVFRVGESPRDILGYGRWVPIMAAWLAMCLAGLLEYTWGALAGSLQAAHHWGDAPVFWAFSFFVIFESFIQPVTGLMRNRGILNVKWATIIGGIICGVVGYGILAESTAIWQAYVGYALLGGIGSGMVYSSCINIVAKWYPEKKGWRTGFVNGGWAYGAVPFIIGIGGFSGTNPVMSVGGTRNYIWLQAILMTIIIGFAGFFMKDPPKNWWPKEIDPLNWQKHSTRDLRSNPALAAALQRRGNVAHATGQMDRDPVRPVHRVLPVRRGLLLPVRPGHASGDGGGGGRLRGFRADRRPGQARRTSTGCPASSSAPPSARWPRWWWASCARGRPSRRWMRPSGGRERGWRRRRAQRRHSPLRSRAPDAHGRRRATAREPFGISSYPVGRPGSVIPGGVTQGGAARCRAARRRRAARPRECGKPSASSRRGGA